MGLIKRLGIIAAGHTAKEGADWLFDYLIYPAVTAASMVIIGYFMSAEEAPIWGPVLAVGIMTPVTGVINYGYLRLYDNVKLDALGAELLKGVRHVKAKGLLGFVVNPLMWLLDWALVLFIAIFEDSFVATIYARKGVELYNGLSLRDWVIFVVTTIISNVAWVGLVSSVYLLSLVSFGYDRIPEPLRSILESVLKFFGHIVEFVLGMAEQFMNNLPL